MSVVDPSLPSCELCIDYSSRVNFSFQQNAIPLIRKLELRNLSGQDLLDVVCKFTARPDWATEHEQRIAKIPAASDYSLSDLPLELSLSFLSDLSDRVVGEIAVEVSALSPGSEDRRVLAQRVLPVEVFAYDEWTGLQTLPEILAAFVTPNIAYVELLQSRVADLLGRRTESSALDGYQSKSKKRVFQMLDCVFDALREQGIRYCNPPASFEKTGQRIRLGEQIHRSKLATCMDLSLLFASVIEALGLRPIVLMHQGHAYVGCWLIEESFPEPAIDDLQTIRKRVDLDEIVVFESTLCCEGNGADFTTAVAAAKQYLLKDDLFHFAIGLYRSRASGIRPLPIKRGEAGIDLEEADRRSKTIEIADSARADGRVFVEDLDPSALSASPQGRIEHWKQQLLDLTLRNRLLNFKETKQTIPIVCPQPEMLEDALAAHQSFQILEQSKLMAGVDPRSLALQERQFAADPVVEHLMHELQAKRLRSSLPEMELSRRLLDLYRRIKSESEESGANTLYLALGFLEWKETKQSDRSFKAPILLIPLSLSRKSAQSGFSIQRHDEDALVNVTLLELLKRDFELEAPGVNPPPEDESGVDVSMVFRIFQQAVKDLPGWEVHREVWIAQFSFSKFLLWKDLNDRMGLLSRNSVVDHLVNRPGEPFVDEIPNTRPEDLDDTVGCSEVFCPVSADSSQLAAIIAASSGKNFVLYGPPGTGKSQTITNLIAHSLAVGKRVLFVAEKRAALEVVHKRLKDVGLAPFCLELHSNKTGKGDVLAQLGEALDFAARQTSEEWSYIAGQLEGARSELNRFVKALHARYPNGLSAFGAYSWLIANRERIQGLKEVESLRIDAIERQGREKWEELERVCEELAIRGSERRLSPAAKEALRPFAFRSWTPDWEAELLAVVDKLAPQAAALGRGLGELGEKLGARSAFRACSDIEAFIALALSLVEAPRLPEAFVGRGDWAGFRAMARSAIAAGRARDAAAARLAGFDIDGVLALSINPLKERFNQLSDKGGLFAGLKKWFLLKPVRLLCKDSGQRWSNAAAPGFFETAASLQASQQELDTSSEALESRFGDRWKGGRADWDLLENLVAFGDALQAGIAACAGGDAEALLSLRGGIAKLLPLADELLGKGSLLAEKIRSVDEDWTALLASEADFSERSKLVAEVPIQAELYLDRIQEYARRLVENRPFLQNWARWQDSCQFAQSECMGPLLAAVEKGVLALDGLCFAFEARYRECFVNRLISLSETLRDFWGEEHDRRIRCFNDLDERYAELAKNVVVARLASELPVARSEECPRNTELGILQRERAKKARHKPVRKLLSEISSIVPRLKPCFLMSPLSVAQYLDVTQDHFDLVVFDEASQIPVWDAVGAIARGKQVVVVGDPKQLPPTNFFGRVDSDDDAIDDGSIQDLESILDECLGSGLATYSLRWHYRSRKEGLIAFSNHYYYENRLHTFPSPHAENVGVTLVPVPEGFYDKGKTRTNRGEAEAIKNEVIRRLRHPGLSALSIGIVTFSQAQQTLVLDKLDEARREHPEIERFFGEEAEEPVFVKNLENVQGDERDVIIFSICYGPDQGGKLSMNFGPVNREGGERRLNVAVTRAKHEILVFSTLRSDQIDLSRTRAKGAEHLKAYLEYAERGPRALAASLAAAQQDAYDSLFEEEVAAFLRRHGHEVHSQVGCSGYRIDLGLVAPEAPGHYLLGIECDGASYHRAATARDRDRLRQMVLEGLGWRIHRIWSTDWWRNRAQAEIDLLESVEQALSEFRISDTPTEAIAEEEIETSSSPAADNGIGTREVVEEPAARYGSLVSSAADEVALRDQRAQPYPCLVPSLQGDPQRFYEPSSIALLRAQVVRIIEQEGPIVESLLARRVAEEWGFARSGGRIRTILARCLPSRLAKSKKGEEAVYWPLDVDPADYRLCRIPTSHPQTQRSIDEIPQEEIQNAVLDALEKFISFPAEDLPREVAKRFGISRVTKNIGGQIEQAIEALKDRGSLRVDPSGVVVLPD